ncbi:phage tail tape measure protein [Pseudomonas oryzihabitans]|uniref:phage tail tape measure protein n=1 Tax=Pseudomonas oryzihabitans TaxID=47885 RepID=UPI00111F312A|nr:phage tail tape measure protein [Pseudomonas psychrotolerans]QDD87506.1 phage tail tape measure protein [Pseudomonas psychrotolerans]QDD91940.1 phage tail tape measure protein [Pseudomonas psychrotolerans]
MATRSLGSLTLDLIAKTGGFEQGMDRAARSMQRFEAETTKQQNDLEKLLGKIDPVVGRLGELDKMEQQLAAHRKANRLPADDYAEYLGKLNAMRDGLTKATGANEKYVMSARAQAAALRGVPAQFTDIVVSLQAGQQPLTVLLQQGGQLKDMFGGIGPAARALGGYVAGMINPFTLLAAAAAALAVAYYEGSKEQEAFRVSLVSTGNLAGKNTGQLADLAKEVSGVTGTTGAAADALAQLVATGSLTSDQFKNMAVAAVAWESATGKAVSDTVAEFKRLADEPTKASAALNEQYNYLTAAVYDQIRALEEQGNKTAAANLAESAYASALQERAKTIKENLGGLESAWKSLTTGAKAAWDAMLNIGREDTLAQQIEKVQKQLDELPARGSLTGRQAAREQAAQDQQRAALELQLTYLKQNRDTRAAISAAEGLAAENERAAIAASTSMHQKYLAGLDKEAQKKNAIAELDRERAARLRVSGADAAAIQREYNVALAGIEDKFKEKKAPRAKAYTDDEATRLLLTLKQQGAALEEQLSTTGKIGPKQRELLEFEQRIADLKEKKTLTADQQSLLASQDKLRTEYQTNAALEKRIQLQQEDAKIAAYRNSLSNQLQSEQDGYAQQLAGMGLSDKEQQRIRERLRAEQQYQRQLRELTSKAELGEGNGGIGQRQYQQELADLQEYHRKSLASWEDFYKQQSQFNADWTNGAKSAFADYAESAANVAAQTKSLFNDAFSGAEDALTNFVKTGKLDFKSLADSIITDLIRIQVRQALVAGISSFTGSATGQSFMSLFSKTQAMGGAWGNGVQMFAKGGAFTNQVVSTPTAFGMAGGRSGIIGEAGPEAVMPLTRTSDGSLGVKALAGRGVGGATNMAANFSAPQQVFHINGDVSPETVQMIQSASQQAYAQAMRDIQKDITRNGPLTRGMRAAIAGR